MKQTKEERNEWYRKWLAEDPRRPLDKSLYTAYRIRLSDWEQMLEEQDGVCFICGVAEVSGKRLAVDHDHRCCNISAKSCGECIRALLCQNCNKGLGAFGDNPDLLRAAADYIEMFLDKTIQLNCKCGYQVLIDIKHLSSGLPTCPCGTGMEE